MRLAKPLTLVLSAALTSAFALATALPADAADSLNPYQSRLAGQTRYATSVAVSGALTLESLGTTPAPHVYVASGEDFPDTLAGGAAASQSGLPLLLIKRDAIPAETLAEIRRLKPERITILGEVGAVSRAVELQLAQLSPDVQRVGGPDRYETAARIARAPSALAIPRSSTSPQASASPMHSRQRVSWPKPLDPSCWLAQGV